MASPEFISRLISEDIRVNNGLLLEADVAMPTRRLGRTGYDVSIFSLGGQGALESHGDKKNCVKIIQRAHELGVNYFDTSPIYGDSEDYYGEAIQGFRNKIFLATKTHKRSRDDSLKLIEKSLKRLKTDYIDLWQIHHLSSMDEVDEVSADDGALQALVEMKEQGVVKYLGFTGHEDPKVLTEMSKRFKFDTVLCALNVADKHIKPSFIENFLPKAKQKRLGIIGMKVFAQGFVFHPNGIKSSWEPLNYVLSLPVSTVIVGCDDIGQLEENVAVAKLHRKLSKEEMKQIEKQVQPHTRRAQFFRKKYGGYDSRDKLGGAFYKGHK